jgi:transcriptional regulator with XRE-family HTH domain
MELDYELVSRQFVRALRGRRSQTAFSRRLGYSTNVVYMWEAGRSFPSAASVLGAAQKAGRDVRAALLQFYRVEPEWLQKTPDPTTPAAVSLLLQDLLAGQSIVKLAARIGRSRFATARWLHGAAEPRLPDFLRLIQGTCLRLVDFIAALVDPMRLPAVRAHWQRLETSRKAAYEAPWTHGVLRVLELRQYNELPRHRPGFIANLLGIDRQEEDRCLRLLADTGQIRMERGRWVQADVLTVDTRRDATAATTLRRFWTQLAVERVQDKSDNVFSFNLGTLAERDLERVRALHRRYFNELRTIIAESEPPETVLLANVQLIRLV